MGEMNQPVFALSHQYNYHCMEELTQESLEPYMEKWLLVNPSPPSISNPLLNLLPCHSPIFWFLLEGAGKAGEGFVERHLLNSGITSAVKSDFWPSAVYLDY